MTDKIRQMVLCMAAALVLGAVGTSARAAFYSPVFDPEFNGNVLFFIDDPCVAQDPGTYPSTGACQVDLISASIFAVNPAFPLTPIGFTYTSGLQTSVGIDVVIAPPTGLIALSTIGMSLFSCGIDDDVCLQGVLQFSTETCEGHSTPCAFFTPAPSDPATGRTRTAGYTLQQVQVPEPGTLGLILGGLFAAWRIGRRKTAN